jgi:signal transduction histidine kinase
VGARTLVRFGGAPEATAISRRIAVACGRMERLIRDLLDWSSAELGRPLQLCAREADLHELCARISDELWEPEGNRIRVEAEGNTRAIFDPDRVEQVIGNLLSNALRHAPAGTPILLRAVGAEREVRIEVHDQGPGVDPEARARIFEAFEQGAQRRGQGVGLGLFIVQSIVAAHGGRVEVNSEPGRTVFTVRLPRVERPTCPEAGDQEEPQAAETQRG